MEEENGKAVIDLNDLEDISGATTRPAFICMHASASWVFLGLTCFANLYDWGKLIQKITSFVHV